MEQGYRILVVDDEEDIIEIISYNLKKEGFIINTASNGEQALQKAREEKPDLIILDIMMPEKSGIEVCREIRKDEEFGKTLIAFLTARNEDYTQISALESGGDDYIAKPIKPGVLVSRIKALLRRLPYAQEVHRSNIIEVGGLIIDLDKIIVIKGQEEIEMAKKEFELLALLASVPGKVFKRTEILDSVWGSDVIVGNRTIDVHVRKIREKIGDYYIKTVKGVGYKFDF